MPFVKLDCGILNSTLWFERTARELFITSLLMAEPIETTVSMPQIAIGSLELTGWSVPPGWYGFVAAAGIGLMHRAGVADDDNARAALASLGEPEATSRSKEYDGRRLVRVDGGFIVLNFMKYRDRDYTAATRAARYRKRKQAQEREQQLQRDIVTSHRDITQAEAEAEAEIRSSDLKKQANLEVRAYTTSGSRKKGARPHQKTPIIGRNVHLNHVLCDDSLSYCVPASVHHKLAGLLAPKHGGDHDRAAEALLAWYPTVWGKLVDGFVMGDAFKFWQTQFDGTFASAPTTSGRDEKAIVAHALASMRKDGTIGS